MSNQIDMILIQGPDYVLSEKETFDDTCRFDKLQKDSRQKIVDYFMNIKDEKKLENLQL
ncbi:MAG: hypothetical protein WA395_00090 [Nitrososphaeraceae archaeon]